MKKVYLIMLSCVLALHAWTAAAENRFYIEDFSIDPGATVDVAIMLDNEVTDFASFQADLYIPEGLELVQQYNVEDEEYYTFSLTSRKKSRMAIGSATQSDGAVRLMLTQTMGSSMQTISGTSGALVSFQVKAADNASGTKYIRLENIIFTTASATQYTLENSQATVTVTGPSEPEDPTSGNRFYIEDFSIDPGATVDVAIMLDNEVTDFASFQADLYIPEGLELVQQYNAEDEEYYTFSLTSRKKSRMAIGSATQSDGAVRLMLTQTMGSSMQTISGTSGALVTFKVKAADNASGTKYIRLENIIFTTATATQYTLENSQATVTVTGSTEPEDPTSGNRFYIEDFSIDPGATVDVAIMLDNEVTDFASFQADLYIPEGLELVQQYNAEDEEYYTFSLTSRKKSRMAIGSASQSDGAVRLMLTQTMGSSMQTISGTSGALVTFKVKAADNASGTKYIRLENVIFTTASATQYTLENSQATVSIGSSTPAQNLTITTNVLNMFTGTTQVLVVSPSASAVSWTSSDPAVAVVSADGTVTAVAPGTASVTCTLNGETSTPFTVNVFLLGDVNSDKIISIADAVAIVNIILNGGLSE